MPYRRRAAAARAARLPRQNHVWLPPDAAASGWDATPSREWFASEIAEQGILARRKNP